MKEKSELVTELGPRNNVMTNGTKYQSISVSVSVKEPPGPLSNRMIEDD